MNGAPPLSPEIIAWLRGKWAGTASRPTAMYFMCKKDLEPHWLAHRKELLALWRAHPSRFRTQAGAIERAGLEASGSILASTNAEKYFTD